MKQERGRFARGRGVGSAFLVLIAFASAVSVTALGAAPEAPWPARSRAIRPAAFVAATAAQPEASSEPAGPAPSDLAAEYMNQAAAAYLEGQLELAAELYQKACDADPRSAEACYRLATVYEIVGELAKAIEAYERLMKVGEGERWAQLAATRLASLRSRAALERLALAERLAAGQSYGEALKYLREASAFAPFAPLHRKLRQRFYQYAAEDFVRRLESEMNKAALQTVATARLLAGSSDDEQNAIYFASLLRASLAKRPGLTVTSAEIPAAAARKLLEAGESEGAEVAPLADSLPSQVDCLLVGAFAQQVALCAVSLRNGAVLAARKLETMGPVPPVPASARWHQLPSRPDTNNELWGWVWGEDEVVPPDVITPLHVQVNQSCYVTLIKLASDGTLELLLPSKGRPDNFLRERQVHTFEVNPGNPGQVGGVWMIASRTPLSDWSDLPAGTVEVRDDAIKQLTAALNELPRASWTCSTWTWRVRPRWPLAIEEARRAPQE